MPLQATSGAASYDGFGGGAAAVNYIEDVFSTYLYTGNGSTQTITNGIDLAGKGGLVWIKCRNTAGTSNTVFDTARGATKYLNTNATGAQGTAADTLTAFNSNGFALGADSVFGFGDVNASGRTYASWTFRKQPKFFDVVTYTGNGVAGRTVAHNLGSVPGMIVVKRTDTASIAGWYVYHRSLNTGAGETLLLNSTNAASTGATSIWNNTVPTSTQFTVGTYSDVNASGGTYVAYLFAHNAGGFGLTGLDNVISCGSYTGNGSATGPTVTLGYEPQWLLVKKSSVSGTSWTVIDTMRGMAYSGNLNELLPNVSNAENSLGQTNGIFPTATGFNVQTTNGYFNESGSTYIYVAIRRGLMKTPTGGTSVFSPNLVASPGTGSGINTITTNFPVDMTLSAQRNASQLADKIEFSRLTGENKYLATNLASAEQTILLSSYTQSFQSNTALIDSFWGLQVGANSSTVYWNFRRAPGFFDVVAYTGDGVSGLNVNHNLGAVPEMMIVKSRTVGSSWYVYTTTTGNANTLVLNATDASTARNVWGNTTPTSSVFTVGLTGNGTNNSGATYIAYLFASLPGISKVGTYTGNGTSQTINCGFTGGSRFVLIKRTDSTGNWTVFDSARGIVAGNDPALYLNSTAAEVTTIDAVDTDNSGFIVNQDATLNLNVNAATYIFLAIA